MSAEIPPGLTRPVAPGQRSPTTAPPRSRGPGTPRRELVARRRRPSGEPPPLPRQLHRSGRWWLIVAVGTVALLTGLALASETRSVLDRVDHPLLRGIAALRTDWLTDVMRVLGSPGTVRGVQLIWWVGLVAVLVAKRWRHLLVWFGALFLVSWLTESGVSAISRPRPLDVEILGSWSGYAMPSRPMAMLAGLLLGICYTSLPQGRMRGRGKLVVVLVLSVVALSRLYLAQDGPTDVLAGVLIGVGIPIVLFRLFLPNDVFPVTWRRGSKAHLDVGGLRGEAIRRALEEQLGVVPVEVKPFGLEGSGGSTPLRITVKGDPDSYLFGKLYSITHVRSDRSYKLGRTLLYGRLEDERSFQTVRRLVQYEDYALRLLLHAGLPVPEPLGIVEITPEREYLLVTEFFDGAREVGEVGVDEDVIDQGLRIVRRLWDAGLAHRDIKPANLLVRDNRLLVIDSAFAEVRPSPWRQAVDLANMMLVLALSSSPQQVADRARIYFTDEEIAEAFAATRGLAMPTQLRRMMRERGRNLHAEFLTLLPLTYPPIAIQRWTVRRAALSAVTIVAAVFATIIVLQLLTSPL
ncbi:MAG: glycosyltransferase 2 family protein [Frankiaceae bacterium]|jgi:tRNA A-37 threonylcarbamoyl transferase component Bud32/membrane-associated phospholipid phosphatase|nr:glycosyltransferase 2 family protein [Frankiaceae bacterium]